MQISVELAEQLKKYVRLDQPFGPPDAADIKEPECAAALFDWHNSAFAEMITGSDVFIGRRGAGKSALLSTFKGKRYLKRDLSSEDARPYRERLNLGTKALAGTPEFVVEADTPDLIFSLEEYCARLHAIPPVEILIRLWTTRIWQLVASVFQRDYPTFWSEFPDQLRQYTANNDIMQAVAAGSLGEVSPGPLTPESFGDQMAAAIIKTGKRCVVTFDNMERYRLDEVQNSILGGLIAATGKMIGTKHPCLDVKLCLPAELFEHLESAIFRPDKDMQKVQYLHWSTTELMHLAASRLKVFLQLYDPDGYERVKDFRFSDRSTLRKFWNRYLPERIPNSLGTEEDTSTYLLRHTQLLPRQLLNALNSIAKHSRQDGRSLFKSQFSPRDIRTGIEDSENSNASAALAMFESVYPQVRKVFDACLPSLTRVFDYGYLHSVYNRRAKLPMDDMQKGDFQLFWRLLLSTGAVGVIDASHKSDIYETGIFEFNSKYTLKISEKDRLCVHPMFSRIYNVDRSHDGKVVLPRGSDFGGDEAI